MRPSRLVPIAVSLALLWLASPVAAELAKWDQDRVTALAEELVEKANAVQQALRNEPNTSIGSGQSQSYYRLVQTVRRIRTEARQLSSELNAGKGYEETLPIYKMLMTLVEDAREEARRTFTSDNVTAKATAAGDVLRRIAPYYDPDALDGPGD